MIHTVKGFSIVNEAEINVFLEFSCFFYDPTDVGTLISGSSAFSKSSLNIWRFSVHVLLKPSFENFEHYFASMWNECNCGVVWTFFGIALLWDWNENWPNMMQWKGHSIMLYCLRHCNMASTTIPPQILNELLIGHFSNILHIHLICPLCHIILLTIPSLFFFRYSFM